MANKPSGRSRGGSKSNTYGVPSNKKPTNAGSGGGGVLSAPGVDLKKPPAPVTVDPKTSSKAVIKNMKGGDLGGKRKGRNRMK